MRTLGERLADGFHRRHLGRRMRVLWEDADELGPDRRWSGLTENYIRVLTETDSGVDLSNEITAVDLDQCVVGAMLGSVPGLSRSGIQARPQRGAFVNRES
jgi:hypothetical protein